MSSGRLKARAILMAGLGRETGPEAWREGMQESFNAVFPPGCEKRAAIEQMLELSDNLIGLYRDTTIGTVYVVGFDGYVKIGFTVRPLKSRIAGLQTGCPVNLTIYAEIAGTVSDEKRLQQRFSAHRSEREWFRREGSLAEWIDVGCPT